MPTTNIDVCAGGNVDSTSTSITFKNDHPNPCTITGLGTLVDCGNSFTVPAQSGGTAGTKTCNILSSATAGTYPYTTSPGVCGPQAGNPSIILQ